MNISAILLAMVVVGGTGLLIAILLGIASEKFKVPVDEKEVAIRAELPGNNCGGCGYAGCDGLAKAIANGEAPVNGCPVGGAAAAEKISAIMGVEAGEFVKKVAFVKCAGTCEKASDKYQSSELYRSDERTRCRTKRMRIWMYGIWKLCSSMSRKCDLYRERNRSHR
mgnify:CR=1 FL=1|jgi:electron transport complex protein RnfB